MKSQQRISCNTSAARNAGFDEEDPPILQKQNGQHEEVSLKVQNYSYAKTTLGESSTTESSSSDYGTIQFQNNRPYRHYNCDEYFDDSYKIAGDNDNNTLSLRSMVSDVFSDLRSESTAIIKAGQNEAHNYLNSTIWQRAFPERLFALTVTLLFEIPVLLMVSGGSDQLCGLIGRTKYQLLIGFLPLSSAISGNVGLQASTLTTRAVSHEHVTPSNYTSWLQAEIGAALCLGLSMGTLLGTIAFGLSGFHFGFAMTIMIAQFISILTAGLTGTLAPLLFSFIFQRDSGKWGGPLETAIQDIIGSFAMVVMSYQILKLFAPFDIESWDNCGTAN